MSNFECKKCGKCCSNILPLKKDEIETMKKLAKKENKHIFLKGWEYLCPFLNNKNECEIYHNRPLICRSYDCYKYEHNIYDPTFFQGIDEKEFTITDVRKEIFGDGN